MYNNLLSKKSKKAISALLASALVISAAPTSVAEAAVTKTFTLGVGKTATKTVSATIKSVKTSKKAVVTVKKVAAKKYKLTAKAAGKATVTVKYGKKTLKATVKVGATKVTKKAFNATMKVNETQSLKIGTTNGKKDTIKWSTSDANVVSIAKTSTKASAKGNTSVVATAVAAGTAKVTAKSKFTGKKATFAITVEADATTTPAPTTDVTVSPSTDVTASPSTDVTVSPSTEPTATPEIKSGVTAKVQNEIPGYANVVLVNDNAIVTVSVKDDAGKPLANRTVIMTADTYDDHGAFAAFEVKGNTVVTTNEKGEASFVIGQKLATPTKVTTDDYAGSAKYTATVVGENKSYTGYVGFASILPGAIDWDGDDDKDKPNEVKDDNLVPGANAKNTKCYDEYSYNETTNLENDKVQYIGAQQVSSAGNNEHKVTFTTNPQIYVPKMGIETVEKKEYVQPINEVSGEYRTNETRFVKIVMDKDMSQLEYATLNFNSVQLSKYTKMTIECFYDADCKDEHRLYVNGETESVIAGELDQKNFAYQIPKAEDTYIIDKNKKRINKSIKAIKVTIHSKGQVQTNRNDGYDIKDITAVYNTDASKNGDYEDMTNAKITWEAITPTYSEIKELTRNEAIELGISADPTSTFTYQVPVFPYTGNAVITERDANGQVAKYYVVPTDRKVDTGHTNTNDIIYEYLKDESDNYLLDKNGDKIKNGRFKKAYQVSEEEALNRNVGVVTQEGNSVTINSEKVGSTTVRGTISIDGIGSDIFNEASSKIYTSVQWNPIPNKAETVADSEAAIALAGQKMEIYAQLTDKNGNPVSLKDEDVTFKYGANKETINIGSVSGGSISVLEVTKTDVNGKARLVVSSPLRNNLLDVCAEVAGNKYNVVLTVGDAAIPSEKVDLYWVNANLKFTKSVDDKGVETNNNTVDAEASNPTVGTPWEFGFETIADKLTIGTLEEHEVTIEGLKIQTVNYEDNKGTYTEVKDADGKVLYGKIAAESKYDNKDKITAKIDDDSIGNDVVFVVTKDGVEKRYVCAGKGTANINAKINLSVDWDAVGTDVEIKTVEGTSISESEGKTTMYIKVTDGAGVNSLEGKKVTVTTNEGEGNLVSGTVSGSSIEVTTDEHGIAKVTLEKIGDSKSVIVSAKVDNTDQITSKTINWVAPGNPLAVLRARKLEDNKVEVTFNNDIYAGSVVANEFMLTGENDGKTVTYSVKDATVSGNKVILTVGETLSAGEYTVTIDKYVKETVEYNLVDERGQKVTNDKVNFYSTKEATYDVSVTASNEITVSNVISPVNVTGASVQNYMFVTVNDRLVAVDRIETQTKTVKGEDVVTGYVITLKDELTKDNVVRVCYMGTIESVTVK